MRDFIRRIFEDFKNIYHNRISRTAVLLCLSALIALGTVYALKLNGITLESGGSEIPAAEAPADGAAHTHNAACYDAQGVLICDAAEPAPDSEAPADAHSTTFEERAGDLRVSVEADAGAFPEGTYMRVRRIAANAVMDAVESVVDGQVTGVRAVDITFFDALGREIEPDRPIRVSISAPDMDASEAPVVVHVDSDGSAEVVEQEPAQDEAVRFTADSFSIYVLVSVSLEQTIEASDGKTYTVRVTYGEQAGIPEGAKLRVREIRRNSPDYAGYLARAESALGVKNGASHARFFDIGILHGGAELQPDESVGVSIELADMADERLQVVHFGAAGADVLETEADGSTVRFAADGFSVYAVVGTTIEKSVLASDGHNYRVTVTYSDEAGIPEGADLEVAEILPAKTVEDGQTDAYQQYASMVRDTLGWESGSAAYLRLFDIKIVGGDGKKIEISAPVDVKISLADKDAGNEANTQVVHFADGAKTGEVVGSAEIDGGVVSFEASGFSAYAIVEGPEPLPMGWHKIASMEEFMSMGSDGLYIGHTDGFYFMNTLTADNARTGITKTKPANSYPVDQAAMYYFEPVEGTDNKVYAYCYAADGTTRQYVYNGGNNSLSFVTDESQKTAFTVTMDSSGYFKLNNGAWYWNMQGNAAGTRFCSYNVANDRNNNMYLWYFDSIDSEPYGLDGRSTGLMYWNGGIAGKAMMADATGNTLDAKPLNVMRTSNNSDQLFAPNDSDITMWTFHWISEDRYYLTAVVDGSTKYLQIDENGLSMVSAREDASEVQVIPGTGSHLGQICLKSGTNTLTYSQTAAGGFSTGGTAGSEWLYFVELSELTTDYFLTYSAEKVSVSDESITNGSRVIVYTRSWNEENLKYDYYAISSDGTLVPVYESGDSIEWVSGQINTLLWNFVEYYWEGTTDPNHYYELYNQYSEQYIAPQVTGGQILSDSAVGINLNGRRDGQYYSTILAWDEDNYSYVGLKVEDGQIVTCPKSEAMDVYFAVMQDLNVDDTLTTVRTVDNTQYGITMKIVDFSNRAMMSNFLGNDDGGATLQLQQGLLSTNLTAGYPTAARGSLGTLFAGAQDVNHLFIQSTYRETGYFEFDSAQNFASLRGASGGDFTVYKELGSYDSSGERPTLKHGQFFPFNDLKAGTFTSVNGKNLYSATGALLPDSDARKYEQLYSVEYDGVRANCHFGLELEASFTQTPSGLDAWGHDIIFEFTGDDDFWLYVDGELVIDLGGIHSAVPGSVNFRTGAVNVNGTRTTLRELFERNYRTRNPDDSDADVEAYLARFFDPGSTVFKDDTTHTMNIFYMERGAGASNLHMRFNLAAVKKGTVQLSKTLSGVDESDILAEFPYQILYKKYDDTEYYLTNSIVHSAQNTDYVLYKDSVIPAKYRQSVTIDGTQYQDVFFLKPGQAVDVSFPEGMTSYRIVECGVNTEVYDSVSVNGTQLEGTAVAEGSARRDYSVDYETTDNRPKVKYDNEANPDALRTLTIGKRLYREDGSTEIPYSEDGTTFTFRLYLASEFDELTEANMHTYHVKDPDGYYCRWDASAKKFVRIGEGIRNYAQLSDAQKAAASFTTSIYGTISNIPTGHTVEVRDVLAGTKFRVVERPAEIPDGYSFQMYEYNGSQSGNDAATGITDTVTSDRDPSVVVRNLKGWGLRMNKVWRDEDYMSARDDAYFALFTRGDGDALNLVEGSVRQLPYSAAPQSVYWYYDRLPVPGTSGLEDYIICEVTISAETPTVGEDGTVTNYGTVTPIADGGTVTMNGVQKGETTASEFVYTVQKDVGEISSESDVRVDTITNDRPGILLRKTDWNWDPLEGAIFTLKDSGGNLLGSFTSGADGLITTAFLSSGRAYTLTETRTPQGYHGMESDMTIQEDNGVVTVSGPDTACYTLTQAQGNDPATLTVRNRPFTFRAVKMDGDTNTPMQGVKFALHRQVTVDQVTTIDLNPMPGYEALVTDGSGVIPGLNQTLPPGTYELREKQTLSGYELLNGYIRFTVSPTGAITLGSHPDEVTLAGVVNADGTLDYTLTVLNSRKKKLSFQKIDISHEGTPVLAGAVFDLYRGNDADALYTDLTSGPDGLLSDSLGNTVFSLPVGTYRLVETAAPEGFMVKTAAVVVTVTASDVTYDEGTSISSGGSGKTYDPDTRIYTLTISNSSGFELPEAGGTGTYVFYLFGGMLLLIAALLVLKRKRA